MDTSRLIEALKTQGTVGENLSVGVKCRTTKTKKKNKSSRLPLVLSKALERVDSLKKCFRFTRSRTIRSDFWRAVLQVLSVLVKHSALVCGGACLSMVKAGHSGVYIPCTVDYLTQETGLNSRTVERVLKELCSMKFLQAEKQQRLFLGAGRWRVYACIRKLTARFWDSLGLLQMFVNDCKHALEHSELASSCIRALFCDVGGRRAGVQASQAPVSLEARARQAQEALYKRCIERGDFESAKLIAQRIK